MHRLNACLMTPGMRIYHRSNSWLWVATENRVVIFLEVVMPVGWGAKRKKDGRRRNDSYTDR